MHVIHSGLLDGKILYFGSFCLIFSLWHQCALSSSSLIGGDSWKSNNPRVRSHGMNSGSFEPRKFAVWSVKKGFCFWVVSCGKRSNPLIYFCLRKIAVFIQKFNAKAILHGIYLSQTLKMSSWRCNEEERFSYEVCLGWLFSLCLVALGQDDVFCCFRGKTGDSRTARWSEERAQSAALLPRWSGVRVRVFLLVFFVWKWFHTENGAAFKWYELCSILSHTAAWGVCGK